MSLTSKSPQDVAREALAAGTAALAPYSHKFSPRTFTQPQLFACLALRKFHKTDYRGIVAQLRDHSDLREILGLKKVPHFTTLQKAAVRLFSQQVFRALLRSTLQRAMKNRRTVLPRRDGLVGLRLRTCQPLLRETPRQRTKSRGIACAEHVL